MIEKSTSLELLAELEEHIPEFERAYDLETLKARLEGRKSLILIAREGDKPVGYKVGYQDSPKRFYSWIGGVLPEHRRRGWARKLLHSQEEWCREEGYREVSVWTANRYRGMLIFLLLEGYDIYACATDGKVQMRKLL